MRLHANLRTNHKEHALGIASPFFTPGTPDLSQDPDKLGHCAPQSIYRSPYALST
jgi:hypothetical protein